MIILWIMKISLQQHIKKKINIYTPDFTIKRENILKYKKKYLYRCTRFKSKLHLYSLIFIYFFKLYSFSSFLFNFTNNNVNVKSQAIISLISCLLECFVWWNLVHDFFKSLKEQNEMSEIKALVEIDK